MMNSPLFFATASVALLLATAIAAGAHDKDQRRFEKLYYDYLVPDTDLYYASCKVCHVSKRKLNSYGKALRRAKKAGMKPEVEIYLAVEEKDSDYDGVSNGEEIRLGTKPGDADSYP